MRDRADELQSSKDTGVKSSTKTAVSSRPWFLRHIANEY